MKKKYAVYVYLGAMLCTTSSWFEGGPYIFTLEVAIVRLNERGIFSILKRLTDDLLDLGWVCGSCPRILYDTSPQHSVQHECLSVSINRLSTNLALGRPLPLCPWTGFQMTALID